VIKKSQKAGSIIKGKLLCC